MTDGVGMIGNIVDILYDAWHCFGQSVDFPGWEE